MSATSCRQPPPCTPIWERRLVQAAGGGDRAALHRLLALYEPMLRYIVARLYLPGGERDDLLQEARLALLDAACTWDPSRNVPFRCFAWLCTVSGNADGHQLRPHAQPPDAHDRALSRLADQA